MKIFKLFFVSLTLLIFLITPKVSFAQEKIDNFDVNVTASKDGSMVVEENIRYDFGEEYRHGIFRNIPLISKVGDLYRVIKIDFLEIKRDNRDEKYKVDQAATETQVKIGDPNLTIKGEHLYLIKYKVENGIGSNFEDHDEIYWNATGNDWEVPIASASASVVTDFGVNPTRIACFTRSGNFNAQFCTFLINFNPVTTTNMLNPGEGLTVVYGFPVNTFPKSVLQKSEPTADPDFLNFLKVYIPIMLVLNFILAPAIFIWYQKKKSKVRFGPATVNFDFPKDEKNQRILPAEAGAIDNTKLEQDDIAATIFDLANRKYLKIEETKEVKAFRPDKTDYKLVKLREYDEGSDFEQELWDRLFKGGSKEIALSKLKTNFYVTFAKLEDRLFVSLIEKNIYIKNPKAQKSGLSFLGIMGFISLNFVLGAILIFLARQLNGRTVEGDKLDWEIDGLKIFLKSMSRHYKFQVKNLITVEKYIPYAIALGLQKEFMDQLKIIAPDYKPSWYSGNGNFYAFYPAMSSSMSSNFTTVAPSSSSGFSGGSSGGGGGGGGGGSW